MDKKTAIGIRKILEKELTPILKKAGYTFELGNASFDEDMVHFKGFKILEIGAKPEMLKHLEDENEHRLKMGKKLLSLDRVAPFGNQKCKLVGFKPRARKKPFIVEDINTKKKYVLGKIHGERVFAISK